MGVIYLAALIVGLGVLVVQFSSAAGDGDAGDGGHDADHPGGHGPALIFLSLRFWTYGALAFGIMGSILHYFELTGSIVTLAASSVLGLCSGTAASLAFRALSASQTSSGAGPDDVVGGVGRVLVALSRDARGKVRVETRGQSLDFLATTDEESLEAGASVVVVEMRGDVAHVARAPRELREED